MHSKSVLMHRRERHEDTPQTLQIQQLSQATHDLKQLPPPEDQLVEIMWSESFISGFVIIPGFVRSFQDMLRKSFAGSPEVLRDAYLAAAAAFVQIQNGELGNENLSLNRSSMSIERLRRFQPKDRSQLALLTRLGMSIVTFEFLTSSSSSHAIVAHTLLSLKPWLPLRSTDLDLDFNVNLLVLMDIVNCVMYREVPIMRHETDNTRIDRCVGLTGGLFPVMYDICLVSHKHKYEVKPYRTESEQDWAALALTVQNWHAYEPPGFSGTYQDNEIVTMRTQASIYRNALLLLIHRIQHPYGEIDAVAQSWSGSILSSLETSRHVTGRYPLPSFFPLLIASFEVVDSHARAEIVKAIDAHFPPVLCQFLSKLKRFLKHAWEAKDSGCVLSWDQMVRLAPRMFFMP